MNIEFEMKINEEDEKDNSNLMQSLGNTEKHEVLFSAESSSLYSSTRDEAKYDFDYEINLIRFGEEKEQEYMYIKVNSKILGDKYIKIDPSTNLYDTINIPYSGDESIFNTSVIKNKFKANIFKRLVSKKKRRIQTEYYDLDMAYITERVIGMGFPATGCETLYRNSLSDLKSFLDKYHGEYKIYNLCIEKKRIYPKNYGKIKESDYSPLMIMLHAPLN